MYREIPGVSRHFNIIRYCIGCIKKYIKSGSFCLMFIELYSSSCISSSSSGDIQVASIDFELSFKVGLLRPSVHFDRLTMIKKDRLTVNRRLLRCTPCHCTTRQFASRPSLIAVGLSATVVALALISITRCSQARFDTCQEPTSKLHASQWKRRCHRLGRLMSRDVETTDLRTVNRQSDTCSHCRPTEYWVPNARQMFLCFGV